MKDKITFENVLTSKGVVTLIKTEVLLANLNTPEELRNSSDLALELFADMLTAVKKFFTEFKDYKTVAIADSNLIKEALGNYVELSPILQKRIEIPLQNITNNLFLTFCWYHSDYINLNLPIDNTIKSLTPVSGFLWLK